MSTQLSGASVAAFSRIELLYVRNGGCEAYMDAVTSPIDALLNALASDDWSETPRSPLGLEFSRSNGETGTERLVIVKRQEGPD